MELHDGHGLYTQARGRFVTPELIRHATMTATPQDLIVRLRALEAEGVRQVAFIPTPASLESFARDFAEKSSRASSRQMAGAQMCRGAGLTFQFLANRVQLLPRFGDVGVEVVAMVGENTGG